MGWPRECGNHGLVLRLRLLPLRLVIESLQRRAAREVVLFEELGWLGLLVLSLAPVQTPQLDVWELDDWQLFSLDQ